MTIGRHELIDLSVPVGEDLPCWWPGLSPYYATTTLNFEPWRAPARSRLLHIEEHTGTHFDAPTHFFSDQEPERFDGKLLCEIRSSDVPLEAFLGVAAVLDAPPGTAGPGESSWVGEDVIHAYETTHGRLTKSNVVLLRTGWSEKHYKPLPEGNAYVSDVTSGKSPGWPAPDVAFIEALAERGVNVLGVDTPSVGAVHDPVPGHRAALSRGILLIENLTNLSALPARGATFLFIPLSIVGGTGAPGRAVAFVEDPRPESRAR